MRKLKTLSVILVLSFLVLSSAMASPSTWAWATSAQSSEVSEVPAETSAPEPEKLTKDSEASKATSDGWVMVPRSVYEAAIADIEEGNTSNKKGGATVEAAKQALQDAMKVQNKFKYFATLDAESGLYKGEDDSLALYQVRYGASFGVIYKDCIMASIGVIKNTDPCVWDDVSGYAGRISLGIVL